jgi:pectin methylesterase-like acyl-CoA thioesterase
MAKKPPNQGKHWTNKDVRELKVLANQNTPTRVIGLKMGRTPEAVYAKASEEGVSLKPTNQSPYGTKIMSSATAAA